MDLAELFADEDRFYGIFDCKCYCGLTIIFSKFTEHLFLCKIYMKNSMFYKTYLNELSKLNKFFEELQAIKKNTEDMKSIVEYQIGGILDPLIQKEKIINSINKKKFPQSYFEYDFEDYQNFQRDGLIFLLAELQFILQNIDEEFKSDLELKRVQSGNLFI